MTAAAPPAEPAPLSRRRADPMQAGHMARSFPESGSGAGVSWLHRPLADTARQQIEEVPQRAKVVAGTETGVRNPHDGMALAPEDGDARHPSSLRGYVAYIGREGRSRMTHHREFPAAALGEFLLDSGPVGARRHEGRPGHHVLMDAVVAVGPQGAVRAGDTHIVNEDEILVMTEELRQAHRAVDVGELVVLDLLRLDGGERLSHLLPNCGDLPAIIRELSVHIRVFHWCVSSYGRISFRRRRGASPSPSGTADHPRRVPSARCRGSDMRRSACRVPARRWNSCGRSDRHP